MKIDDLQPVINQITECSIARGNPRKEKRYSDFDHQGRMGIVATKRLSKGECITEDKLYGAYPMRGLSILYWDLVVGKKALRNIEAGEPINMKDLDFDTIS
jgi:sialic acid synthase SpsE